MKKIMIIAAVAATFGFATDFSKMSTEELMQMRGSVPVDQRPAFQAEMQKRMQNMTAEERQQYRGPQKGMMKCQGGGGKGMGPGKGMGMGRMAQMPEFSDFDADGNGHITKTEWTEGRAKRMKERAEEGRMMKNAGNAPSFEDIDINGDGKVSPAEFKQHQMQQRGNRMKGMKCNGKSMGPGKGMGMGRMAQMPEFSDFDADGNGHITKTEWTEGRAKRMKERAEEGRMMKNAGNAPSFSDIDTDKDGKVTPAEFQQHQVQQRGNRMKCNAAN